MKVRDFSKWCTENEELVQAGPTTGEGKIKDTEKKMKLTIPGPLRELYRLHDGVEMAHGYVPPLQGDSSLPEMIEIIKEADLGWDFVAWMPFFDYQTGDYDAIEVKSPPRYTAGRKSPTCTRDSASESSRNGASGATARAVRAPRA